MSIAAQVDSDMSILSESVEQDTGAARLHALELRKNETAAAEEKLNAEKEHRLAPHERRRAEIRATIEWLEAHEGEILEAMNAIENEMRPAITAAEEAANLADAAHWEAYKESRA